MQISARGGLLGDLEMALKDGADPNHHDLAGTPTLHMACLGGDTRCIHRLIEAGADIEAEDGKGLTAVQVSVQEKRNTSAILLLDAGADGSLLWPDGKNMLHWAIIHREPRLIGRSIRQGANVHGRMRSGQLPSVMAAEMNDFPCMKALLDHGASPAHLKGVDLSPEIAMIVSACRARLSAETASASGATA